MSTKLAPALLLLAGCTVIHPPGWARRAEPPEVVQPTPGALFSRGPWSWDTAGGDKILLDVHESSVLSGMGFYRQEISFTASYRSAEISPVTCENEPSGPGVPVTRFGCWTQASAPDPLRFWIAPDADCPARDIGVASTLTTPACWHGELILPDRTVHLRHGYLKSSGSPVGYVSWVDEAGEMLLAADIVSDMRVKIYDPAPPRPIPAALRRRLVLLTVALSYWEHASSPG